MLWTDKVIFTLEINLYQGNFVFIPVAKHTDFFVIIFHFFNISVNEQDKYGKLFRSGFVIYCQNNNLKFKN